MPYASEDPFSLAIAIAKDCAESIDSAVQTATTTLEAAIADTATPWLHDAVAQGTETLGQTVTPVIEHPLVRQATRLPALNWIMAVLGQVNGDQVKQDVDALKQRYPQETPEQLAHRMVSETAMRAAQMGLLVNLVPPVALMLAAVDVAAIAALQAEMIYRLAAIYGFSPTEATRRGEALVVWGLFATSSGMVKTSLSLAELLPLLGAIIGAASNATLLYALGHVASRFYADKARFAAAAVAGSEA